MTGTEPTRARVDERVLGAGTNARFALLLVLLVAASGSMLTPVLWALTPGDYVGCELAAGVDPAHASELPSILRTTGQALAFLPCVNQYAPAPPWWQILAGPAAIVMCAAVLVVALPIWKQRPGRCIRLDRIHGVAELASHIQALAAGRLAQPPTVLMAPAARTKGAVVFGTNRRPRLRLDGGLIATRNEDRARFDAVVLHELAHIANKDLTATYATVALWRVFIMLVLLPYLVWDGLQISAEVADGSFALTSLMVRGLALPAVTAVLISLVRADVLRSRELYADLTAHRWGAPLGHVWSTMAAAPKRPRVRSLVAALLDPLRMHPPWDVRRNALSDPAPLFAVSWPMLVLTGIIATLMNSHLAAYIAPHVAVLNSWLGQVLAALPAALVATIAGMVLWRANAHARLRGRSPLTGVGAGVCLGLGFIAGSLINGQATGDLWLPRRPWVLTLVIAVAVALTAWIAQCARLAAGSWPGRSLRVPLALCLIGGWLILSAWLAWWTYYGVSYVQGYWHAQGAERQIVGHWFPGAGGIRPAAAVSLLAQMVPPLQVATVPPVEPAAAIAAWITPLLLWTAGAVRRGPGWIRTTDADDSVAPAWRTPSLRWSIAPGLVGSGIAVLGVAGAQAWLHSLHTGLGQRGGGYAFGYTMWCLAAIAVGICVATGIAAAAPRFRLLTATAAGGISSVLGLVGVTALVSADGCIRPLAVLGSGCAWRPAWQRLEFGGAFSLVAHGALLLGPLAAIAATAIATAVRAAPRCWRQDEDRPPTSQPAAIAPTRVRSKTVAALAAVSATALVAAVVLIAGDAKARLARPTTFVTPAGQLRFQQVSGLPVPTVSPDLRWRQIHAWYRLGGRYLLDHAIGDTSSMTALLNTAVRGSQVLITPTIVTNMRPLCLDMKNVASWEPVYFQVPDPAAETSWHNFGVGAWNGSQDCMRAVDNRDVGAFRQSMVKLLTAAKSAIDASNRVKAIIDDPSDSVFKGQPAHPPQPRL